MQISFSMEPGHAPVDPSKGTVTVGWLLSTNSGGVIFEPPSRVRSASPKGRPAKSVTRCPAVTNLDSRFFCVSCPYDLKLGFQRGEDGSPEILNLLGDKSPVRTGRLSQLIDVTSPGEWRDPERPMFQIKLPYIFVADEPVYLSQVPPFGHYRPEPLPGLMISGRFPIHVWPRPLMWAFEWHDISNPLILKRGEPLFYLQFETMPQDRAVRLVEAKRTKELSEYLELISGAVNYVGQTFSLFEAAEKRRPAKLVKPVGRSGHQLER